MGSRAGLIKQAAGKIGCTPEEWEHRTTHGDAWCYCCRSWRPKTVFGKDRSRSSGLASACKPCVSNKATASRYQIGLAVARSLRSGTRLCEICGRNQKLEVDHNHQTGAVRGMLCSRCNGALGQFCDNEELLAKAIEYLRSRP